MIAASYTSAQSFPFPPFRFSAAAHAAARKQLQGLLQNKKQSFPNGEKCPSPAQYGRVRPGPTLTNPTPSNHPGAKAEPETSPGRSSYPTIPTSHFRTYRTAFPLPHTCALLYAALALSLHRVAHKLYAWPAFFQEAQQPQSSSLSTPTIHSTPHSYCTGSDSAARAVQSQIDTTCGRARFGDTGYDVGIACKKAGRPPFAAFPSFNAGSPDAPPHTHHRPPIPYPYTESTVPRTKRTPYLRVPLLCTQARTRATDARRSGELVDEPGSGAGQRRAYPSLHHGGSASMC